MRYRVFLMLVANSVAGEGPSTAARRAAGPERKVKALQLEPKRTFIEPHLLPWVADVSVVRASLLPPSDRIAVHLQLFSADDPERATDQILHLRPNVLWPVARLCSPTGAIAQVNLVADRRGRVRREYRVVQPGERRLVVGHHGVILDRVDSDATGVELHGRLWHAGEQGRAFAALIRRRDISYTLDLGKLGGHWLRLEVKGDSLLGFSAVSEA